MSSLSPVVQAVRDAGEKLTGSSNLTREEFLRCVRDLDTALRSPGDDGDDACAEFCAGPPDAPHRAALAWFAFTGLVEYVERALLLLLLVLLRVLRPLTL